LRAEIVGATNNDQAEWGGESNGDHIRRDEFTHSNTRIEAVGGEIDQFGASRDLNRDIRIGCAERCKQWPQYHRHDRARDSETKKARWLRREIACCIARSDDVFECRPSTVKKSLTSLG
jgi:hypothetical protein